jgi:hypothetical protein
MLGCYATFEDALVLWEENSENSSSFCPPGCLGLKGVPPVWGSFPYYNTSSLCLAAVHAGVISNATGGVVMATRFFRQTWDNDSTQTVFPFTSARGSYSNGVQSLDVPRRWMQPTASSGPPLSGPEWAST